MHGSLVNFIKNIIQFFVIIIQDKPPNEYYERCFGLLFSLITSHGHFWHYFICFVLDFRLFCINWTNLYPYLHLFWTKPVLVLEIKTTGELRPLSWSILNSHRPFLIKPKFKFLKHRASHDACNIVAQNSCPNIFLFPYNSWPSTVHVGDIYTASSTSINRTNNMHFTGWDQLLN